MSREQISNLQDYLVDLWANNPNPSWFEHKTHEKVLDVLNMADFLSPKYHLVVANPPYMGNKGINNRLKAFLQDNYSDVKSDLFSAFMVRIVEMTLHKGEIGFVAPYVWMFISSYENLRKFILEKTIITSLVQLEYNAFAPACIPVAK
jgi:type I restriction-modification system DNA methylase subunit